MYGMFKANGGCGYVKKPNFLINQGPHKEVFDPKREQIVKRTLKVIVTFSLILPGLKFFFHRLWLAYLFSTHCSGQSVHGGWMESRL